MTKKEQRKRTQQDNVRVQEFIKKVKFWKKLVEDQTVNIQTKVCVFNDYFLICDRVLYYLHRSDIKYCDVTETTLLIIEYLRNYKNLWRNEEFVEMFTKEHNRILNTCTYQ